MPIADKANTENMVDTQIVPKENLEDEKDLDFIAASYLAVVEEDEEEDSIWEMYIE